MVKEPERGQLQSMRSLLVALVLLQACATFAADDAYYRTFLSIIGTNDRAPQAINAPALIDTRNTSRKLTNAVFDLEKFRTRGEMAGIHLGMTMDEVVRQWGKPPHFHPNCGGGPRFTYADRELALIFKQNKLATIILPETIQFEHRLSGESSFKDWVRVLGPPTRRKDYPTNSFASFTAEYETPQAMICLLFDAKGEAIFGPHLALPKTSLPSK
jgi:hypothetical protein